jgi:hypothetical protein
MPDLRRQQGGIPTFFGEPVAVGGGALAAVKELWRPTTTLFILI